jgi:hypothetical protein
MEIVMWVLAILFIFIVIFAADRYLALKEVEKDLRILWNDQLAARDIAPREARVHYQVFADAVKILIKENFTL